MTYTVSGGALNSAQPQCSTSEYYCMMIILYLDVEEEEIFRQAEIQAKSMPLSVVRLSFRAYLLDSTGMCTQVLPPVISNPIFDSSMWILYCYFLFL